MDKKAKQDPRELHAEILEQWSERELIAAARSGELKPAFRVDEELLRLEIALAGGRSPIVTGPSGVGKTALVHELARRLARDEGPPLLRGRRIVELSIRRRAAALSNPRDIGPEFARLAQALVAEGGAVVPFLRDVDAVWTFDLERELEALALRLPVPMLCEGARGTVQAMIEYLPSLEQHFVHVPIDEPDLERMHALMDEWAAAAAERRGAPAFDPEALETALELSHRFLAGAALPRKAIQPLAQLERLHPERPVTEADVVERFCLSYGIPRLLVDRSMLLDLARLEADFRSRVLGQEEAVAAMVDTVALIKAGLSDPRRPFGVFLFVGPTGVGKTHLAQSLAEVLFGSSERMVRLNMADFTERGSAETIFGNPRAHEAAARRGLLTARLRGHPFAVVLLDEFEKAHEEVHDRMLQLFDEGQFVNGSEEVVSCRSVVLIATSNAGADLWRTGILGFDAKLRDTELQRELERQLLERFRFEFLNRIDRVVPFHPLDREAIRAIALRELEALERRPGLRRRRVSVELDDAVLDWLVVHGYHPDYGARYLRRTLERHVSRALAGVLVQGDVAEDEHLRLEIRANEVHVRRVSDSPAADGADTIQRRASTPRRTPIDRGAFLHAAQELAGRAAPLVADLEASRREHGALMARLGDPDFWNPDTRDEELLERFRELDVRLQVEGRLAEPLAVLERTRQRASQASDGTPSPQTLARTLRRAESALAAWIERRALEGPSAVWVHLAPIDPRQPVPRLAEWIESLARMEEAWARRLDLEVERVAVGLTEDGLIERAVLLVEGPGAEAFFAMERGEHRLHQAGERPLRVGVDVLPRGAARNGGQVSIERLARPSSIGSLQAKRRARLELAGRGRELTLVGEEGELLRRLAHDLSPHMGDSHDVARIYDEGGRGAQDPRNGAAVARLKDVLAGRLDRFLEAWRTLAEPVAPEID